MGGRERDKVITNLFCLRFGWLSKWRKSIQLVRKIFQEEFKKQEVHITDIISSNFKMIIEEINKSQEQIKELKKKVTDLKYSVEHTDVGLNDLSDRVDEIYDYQVDPINMSQIN